MGIAGMNGVQFFDRVALCLMPSKQASPGGLLHVEREDLAHDPLHSPTSTQTCASLDGERDQGHRTCFSLLCRAHDSLQILLEVCLHGNGAG